MQGPNPPLTAILHSIHILRIGDVYTVFFDWMETMKFIRFPLEIIANGALLVWGVFSLSLCQQWDSSSCIHKAVSQNQHETQQKEQLMLDKGALKSIADPNWIIQVLYNTESVRVEFNSPIIDSVLMESCLALSHHFFLLKISPSCFSLLQEKAACEGRADFEWGNKQQRRGTNQLCSSPWSSA